MTNTTKTNLENLIQFVEAGGKLPKLVDTYNNVISSNKNKKTCSRTAEIVNLINTSSSMYDFDQLLLKYNQEMVEAYNKKYRDMINEFPEPNTNHNNSRYVIMNPCKLAFNEEQNRIGIVVGYSTQKTGKKEVKLAVKLQIVSINPENGEVAKTSWTVNRTKFLDYATTHKLYKSLGLVHMGVAK